ncbi:Putative transposase [Thiorhodovibrio litoralis]|uniref:IS91 family transposase n=1 Tax=Thiorhodovibrio litoralis TaxID=2952932 RepID=UPI001F5D2A8E|nr:MULTISPECIES: transposase [Thiorhodovibrio]WPL10467.1 Putative transposase [Thiorhodovibrio litoralis]
MILLSSIIRTFESEYLQQDAERILPSQRLALDVLKNCRTSASPRMQAQCNACGQTEFIPHSCGHRACPHCQHHESQQWLERQLAKQVPATYFLLTFTVPEQLRSLVWANQRVLYDHLIRASWETVQTFARNDKQLQGDAGAIAVLHTHSRRLDFHPHVHLVMPAAAIDVAKKRWRTKSGKRGYLFSHKALATVFRAKLLEAIAAEGLALPSAVPSPWVVDCKRVGRGEKALVYLGRYLYRGVIREQDIIACENGQVTFRYRHAKRQRFEYRTLPGAQFLALILQHVLPKGFMQSRWLCAVAEFGAGPGSQSWLR